MTIILLLLAILCLAIGAGSAASRSIDAGARVFGFVLLRLARNHHGGNATDARRWPDEWQSAVCSAWLHEPCPSDAHNLGCTCTCHGRKR